MVPKPTYEPACLLARNFCPADVPALHAIGHTQNVARMMASIHRNWTRNQTRQWMTSAPFHGMIGFRIGVYARTTDTLIGFVGIGGTPTNLAYALGEPHWGRGYATEMVHGLLGHCYAQLGLTTLTAEHYTDNPGSGRVLTKLGFEKYAESGESMGKSLARLEPAPQTLYRLTHQQFKAATHEIS